MDVSPIFQIISNSWLIAQTQVGAADGSTVVEPTTQWVTIGIGAIYVLGIFVIPFVLSHFITAALRMPAHSFRLGVMIAAIFGALIFAWNKDFQLKLGPDMKGGTNLVYDIMPDENGQKVNAGDLASALSTRINPSGTKEITIRPRGESQIEIVVPNTDPLELKAIKDLINNSGVLEFRIVANTRDHQDIIELARQQSTVAVPKSDVTNAEGKVVGRWVTVGRDEKPIDGVFPLKTPVLGDILRDTYTGKFINNPQLNSNEDHSLEKWMQRSSIREVDVLMALEYAGKSYTIVNGDHLSGAAMEFDKSGYVVSFRLGTDGGALMGRLTGANLPDGNFHRRMAIIMDKRVLSAPQLNSTITSNGQITGNFTKAEVEFLVTMLRSGRLPATLSEKPASEERVGAGLGASTIQKGTTASIWAVIATFASMLIYYRFSGVVASIALLINGLLIFGVMIFIGQPLTLPGLAGLVLTVGMSVDANVLIFERIREEKSKGSALRMAIRNGFDRAFTTIIDSNLTTLIAAIVLYWIGTDQVRGFAVALVIGILTSLFTATFCSRIIFEIAEKLKLVNLSMSDGVGFLKRIFLGDADFDFMAWQKTCFAMSAIVIVIGITAVTFRGKDILNIDFTGGTSVTMQLEKPLGADALRVLTKQILPLDQNDKPVQSTLVLVEKAPMNTVYTLVTSIDDEDFLSERLVEGFAKEGAANVKTYRVKILNAKPTETGRNESPATRAMRFVSFQQDAPPKEKPPQPPQPSQSNAVPAGEPAAVPANDTAADNAEPAVTGAPNAIGTEAAPQEDSDLPTAVPTAITTTMTLQFSGSTDDNAAMPDLEKGAKIDADTLRKNLIKASKTIKIEMIEAGVEVFPEPLPKDWLPNDINGYATWKVQLPVDDATATAIVKQFQSDMSKEPLWLSLSKIGTRVAGEMKQRAVAAILLSLVFIVGYIWFRFQKVAYGLAAVVALVHDVMITLGVIALCHWLSGPLQFLLVEDFKIGLTEVAAFLTIIGYSLNDTIVVFDRIREVRGRSPQLTAKAINDSVNQTLSRTLLTSGTTLLTVFLLYVFGGEGIHAFAFALLVGILVGTYSSIFVASPVLLWITNRESANQKRPGSVG